MKTIKKEKEGSIINLKRPKRRIDTVQPVGLQTLEQMLRFLRPGKTGYTVRVNVRLLYQRDPKYSSLHLNLFLSPIQFQVSSSEGVYTRMAS